MGGISSIKMQTAPAPLGVQTSGKEGEGGEGEEELDK